MSAIPTMHIWHSMEWGDVRLSDAFVAEAEARWPGKLHCNEARWAKTVRDAMEAFLLQAYATCNRVRLIKSLDALKPYGLPE